MNQSSLYAPPESVIEIENEEREARVNFICNTIDELIEKYHCNPAEELSKNDSELLDSHIYEAIMLSLSIEQSQQIIDKLKALSTKFSQNSTDTQQRLEKLQQIMQQPLLALKS